MARERARDREQEDKLFIDLTYRTSRTSAAQATTTRCCSGTCLSST
jgi:hypothetical protein